MNARRSDYCPFGQTPRGVLTKRTVIAATGVQNLPPDQPFYILVGNFTNKRQLQPKRMKIAIASEAPKVIFDHTQKEEPTGPHGTRQTVFSAGNTTGNLQVPEDGSGSRGEGSTKSSVVDDLDESTMDGYKSADKSEATSATASAISSPTANIASTAQRSTIISKTIDWESQKEFKPPEQEDWQEK